MLLTLATFKDDPNDWLMGFDCAVIELTPTLAQHYLTLMDRVAILKDEFPNVYELRYWDSTPEWYPCDDDADLIDDVEGNEVQPPLPGAEPSRTEADLVHISDTRLIWQCIAKHTDCRVSTSSVTRATLVAALTEAGSTAV